MKIGDKVYVTRIFVAMRDNGQNFDNETIQGIIVEITPMYLWIKVKIIKSGRQLHDEFNHFVFPWNSIQDIGWSSQ